MNGLTTDVLMQNIFWIRREKPLRVEEIARTLGVAAVYREDKLETLLYVDYMKTAGSGRYQYRCAVVPDRTGTAGDGVQSPSGAADLRDGASGTAVDPPELQEFLRSGGMGSCAKTRQTVRLQQRIDSGEGPNDYDKDTIDGLAAKGYARVENGRPIQLIPYIRKPLERLTQKVREDMTALFREKMNMVEIVDRAIANIEKMKPLIPDYLEENERNSLLRGMHLQQCTCYVLYAV